VELAQQEVLLIEDQIEKQKVSVKSFCKCQFLHKSVNLSFIITTLKNKLADLCGN